MEHTNYAFFKNLCQKVYLVGSGSFWSYDCTLDDRKLSYKLYKITLYSTYGLMTILEILAVAFGEFPDDEMNDCISLAVSHSIVMIKMLSVISQKDFVTNLNRKMIETCQTHEEGQLMVEKQKVLTTNVLLYFSVTYGDIAMFLFEGLRKLYTGSHFVTIVTYYPAYEDDSLPALMFRLFATAIFMMLMLTMISIDCIVLTHLIMYKYKFITLRKYFENLREEFDLSKTHGNYNLASEKLYNGLIEGIKMHAQVIGLKTEIDKAFGTVLAFQLLMSSGSAVALLLQIAVADGMPLIGQIKIILFVIALFFILGQFMCNAGDITYESSLLAPAISNCGWHECWNTPVGRKAGKLVLQACCQAQQPVVLKAYKMFELTHATFLQVAKTTYSVFTLFYAQRQ